MKKTTKRNQSPLEIQLSDKNRKRRIILLCICLAIAITAFGVGLFALLNGEAGWQAVEHTSTQLNCADDFTLQYHFNRLNGSAARKKLVTVYSEATEKAYQMFTPDQEYPGNVYYLNHHPNEIVTVDPALYDAFTTLEESGVRVLYLGPVYAQYAHILQAEEDVVAIDYDPTQDPEIAAYIGQLCTFVNDETAIDLELLGNNQVRLNVSQAYLDFAKENEEENFIDFHWMTNAFIIDYLAQTLSDAGLCNGVLASVDGFTRHLDSSKDKFSFPILDYYNQILYPAAIMRYTGPLSIVNLRAYPLADRDAIWSYIWDDGHITTSHIDPVDGMNKTSLENMVGYSSKYDCADILLKLFPVFVSDTFDNAPLKQLKDDDLYTVWGINTRLYYTQAMLVLENKYADKDVSYKTAYISSNK